MVNKKTVSASHVYAEYTISRIPHKIRSGFTETQLKAIREALVAQQNESKHGLDIRLRIPLFFRAYYFVIFGGRDRRRFIVQLELERINRLPKSLSRSFYLITSALVTAGFLSVVGIALYLIKSFLGIDLFSFHLSDILGVDIYGSVRQFISSRGTND